MKNEDAFRNFLRLTYKSQRTGKPFSAKVASDVLSRCRLVERVTGIQIDRQAVESDAAFSRLSEAISAKPKQFGVSSAKPYAYNQYVYSVRLYREFLLERKG